MKIGIPKEIKEEEYRVGIVPAGVQALARAGHTVFIEDGAGLGSGISNEAYVRAGAVILPSPEEVFGEAEMIIKVKEPLAPEYPLLREGQVVFTYFHFAASRSLTDAMLQRGIIAIAYETIEEDGTLPLLAPMSEIAGRMSVQEGAKCLENPMGGRGVLLGGVPGVPPGKVVIIGGGVVGANAAKMAAGLGAQVTLLDINLERLRYLDDVLPPNVVLMMSNEHNIREMLCDADLVIGAVLVHGAKTPVLISRDMFKDMKHGAVLVDVAIDQGGCAETSRPTTHKDPTFEVDGVIHYCVANIPGAVARTSTFALTNATLPYALEIANKGYARAIKENPAIAKGLNAFKGSITCKAVAESFGIDWVPAEEIIGTTTPLAPVFPAGAQGDEGVRDAKNVVEKARTNLKPS
ncbi:MAG: alanine dehydrogenase [Firmicutes bacterium]|nr:alanine dehydrogenase [Bacillota bacterium]